MDYRQLGGSGLHVPVLTLSAPALLAAAPISSSRGAPPACRRRRGSSTSASTPASRCSTRRMSIRPAGRVDPRPGDRGRRDRVLMSTKGTFRTGPGPNDVGSSRAPPAGRGARQPRAARHRLHRSLSAARLRCVDADRRGAAHARRSGSRREDSLPRGLELFRLAPHEVAGDRRPLRADALRRAPGVLLAHRPRLRMGADAAGARPAHRHRGVEPARLGAAHRQDPPRSAAARRSRGCRTRPTSTPARRSTTSISTKSSTRSMPWHRKPGRPCRRSRSTGCCSVRPCRRS